MLHRAGRAKLLLPSFIAVLGACGGTTVGSDPNGPGPNKPGVGGGAGFAGSTPNIQNPPPPNYGGGAGGAGGGPGGSAGDIAIGGYGANPPIIEPYPACPPQAPAQNSACYAVGAMCSYPTACGETWALCGGLGWSVGIVEDGGCAGEGGASEGGAGPILPPPPPPGPLTCPANIPQQGGPCYVPGNVASYECDYGPCGATQAVCNGHWNVKTYAVDCAGL